MRLLSGRRRLKMRKLEAVEWQMRTEDLKANKWR